MNAKHLLHLYARAGFGITQSDFKHFQKSKRDQIVGALFDESKAIQRLEVDVSEFKNIKFKDLDKKEIQALRKKSRQKTKAYNIKWIERLMSPREILREK